MRLGGPPGLPAKINECTTLLYEISTMAYIPNAPAETLSMTADLHGASHLSVSAFTV
jgi:hypothetical protein